MIERGAEKVRRTLTLNTIKSIQTFLYLFELLYQFKLDFIAICFTCISKTIIAILQLLNIKHVTSLKN